MGRKKEKKERKGNLRLAFFFSVFVILLILLSLSFKAVAIVVQSKFDGTHRFTVAVSNVDEKQRVNIVSFAPDAKTISILVLKGDLDSKDTAYYLGAPIDATIQTIKSYESINEDVSGTLQEYFFTFPLLQTDMNIVDMGRLWLFTRSVPSHSVVIQEASVYTDVDSEKELLIDKLSTQLFTDFTLASERQSIHVINASGIPGIGNKFARMISNSGGIVVSVTTGDAVMEESTVSYTGDPSYTVNRLKKLVKGKEEPMQKRGISDIILTIGKKTVQ